MDNISNIEIKTEQPQLTSESIDYLITAARWGKFLAIIGFVFCGLTVLGGLIFSFVISQISDDMLDNPLGLSPLVSIIFYIILALIFLIPTIFLNLFSNNIKNSIEQNDTLKMSLALANLKNLFKYVGILLIVLLVLYVLSLFAIVLFGFMKI